MTHTFDNFIGFETNGLTEAASLDCRTKRFVPPRDGPISFETDRFRLTVEPGLAVVLVDSEGQVIEVRVGDKTVVKVELL